MSADSQSTHSPWRDGRLWFAFAVCAGLIALAVVAATIGTRKSLDVTTLVWQEKSFILLSFTTFSINTLFWLKEQKAALTIGDELILPDGQEIARKLSDHKLSVLAIIFAFLYIASASVAQRLGFGILQEQFGGSDLPRTLGIVITSFACVMMIRESVLTRRERGITAQLKHLQMKRVRHPVYLAWFIYLIGTPLVFATSFPLFAMPGAVVYLRWLIMHDEEELARRAETSLDTLLASTSRHFPLFNKRIS